jgi:hypothetical protein
VHYFSIVIGHLRPPGATFRAKTNGLSRAMVKIKLKEIRGFSPNNALFAISIARDALYYISYITLPLPQKVLSFEEGLSGKEKPKGVLCRDKNCL